MRTRSIGFLVLVVLLGSAMLFAQQQPAPQQPEQKPAPQQPATTPPPTPQGQEPPVQTGQVFRTTVNLVDVLFTVLNHRNKLVPELEKPDFKVFDNNVVQEIRYFSKQSDLPLRIGMLLDTSNSIRDRIKFEEDAANNFLFSVLRHGTDEAFLMTFDDEPQVVQGFTADTGKLRDQILRMRAGGGTAVYDAIYEACAKELSHPPRPAGDRPDIVRRVMILISDGEDNLSTHTRAEAIEMAQRTNVVIYTISTSIQWVTIEDPNRDKAGNRKYHLTEGDKILQDLADETGGRSFYPYHVDDLDQSFQDIGDELRNQYSIAYNPSNHGFDGRYYKIKIEIPEHKGYQVRARRGYYARTVTTEAAPKPAGSTK
ncbi:MAG TPA: VWA domain-containing protein [Candidatus Acidoferrum sp.]|jgi:VWFA-related protein